MIKISGGGEFNNVKVLSLNEVLERYQLESNLYIINNTMHPTAIKKQLLSLGADENKIDLQCYHIANAYFNKQREFIYTYIDEYEKVYAILKDERSKEIYLAKLNYLLSGDGKYLEGLMDDNKQYFDKNIIKLTKDEVFIDCGSFDGDTLNVFNKLTQGKYKEYIALEADNSTYEKLVQKIKEKKYANVITFKCACWNKKTKLKFDAQKTGSSSITDKGNVIVQADSLDHLLGDRPVTFIKMDIEGAEENALKGAENLIRKYKPTLAICIYHKIEDYYKLPLLMKEFNEEYQLFIRHYSQVDCETVCYVIPKERLIKSSLGLN